VTEPSKIRTKRVVGEVLLQTRREQMDLEGGMGVDTLEHVHQ
jgi:hypothetical protein